MAFKTAALLLAVLFLAVTLPAPLTAEEMNPPPRGVVLLDKEAEFLLLDNSFETELQTPIILWHPSPADIDRLEKLLPEYMRQLDTPPEYQPLQEYYRQYAGVIREGKKLIFVNFFHSSAAKNWAEWFDKDLHLKKRLTEKKIQEDRWLYLLLGVGDGGAYFFSVRFDVETGTFLYASFNGHA